MKILKKWKFWKKENFEKMKILKNGNFETILKVWKFWKSENVEKMKILKKIKNFGKMSILKKSNALCID